MNTAGQRRDDDPRRWEQEPFCYLTTTGRVSGNPHTIEIWFALDPEDPTRLAMMAGGGRKSDWVRNLEQTPDVTIRLGDLDLPCDGPHRLAERIGGCAHPPLARREIPQPERPTRQLGPHRPPCPLHPAPHCRKTCRIDFGLQHREHRAHRGDGKGIQTKYFCFHSVISVPSVSSVLTSFVRRGVWLRGLWRR